jgi:hypothetical protein
VVLERRSIDIVVKDLEIEIETESTCDGSACPSIKAHILLSVPSDNVGQLCFGKVTSAVLMLMSLSVELDWRAKPGWEIQG